MDTVARYDQVQFVSWTGGAPPNKPSTVQNVEWEIVKEQYRWHIQMFTQHWGEAPEPDVRRRFWKWARYDAHSSIREWKRMVH